MKKDWGTSHHLNPMIYLANNSFLSEIISTISQDLLGLTTLKFNIQGILNYFKYVKNFEDTDVLKYINQIDFLINKKSISESNVIETRINCGNGYIGLQGYRHILFTKPYIGDYNVKGKYTINDYIFYNEREWRYIPLNLTEIDMLMTPMSPAFYRFFKEKYNDVRSEADIQKVAYENYIKSLDIPYNNNSAFLNFTPNDISFIIVHGQKDVEDLIDHILNKKTVGIGGKKIESDKERYALISKILSYEQIKEDIFSH
ncbi:abortive infection system antitoxin AbiGi family protein [Salmonirosea aquatica]